MNKLKSLCALVVCMTMLGIAFTSCRKEADDVIDPTIINAAEKPSTQFDTFWQIIDRGYVFFADDPTDWDEVYDRMYPKFEALDSRDSIPTAELFALYKQAVETLIDHHMTITIVNKWAPTSEKIAANGFPQFKLIPGLYEIMKRDYYYPSMTPDSLITYYDYVFRKMQFDGLMEGRMSGAISRGEGQGYAFFTSAILDEDIAYLHFTDFMLNQIGVTPDYYEPYIWNKFDEQLLLDRPCDVLDAFYDDICSPDIKGIVIDLRHNNGGDVSDLYTLVGALTTDRFVATYTRHKQGLGRLDLSEWMPLEIPCNTSIQARRDVPVAVLVNLYSISMGEMTPMALRARPNGRCAIIGERTYGGNGPLMGNMAPILTYGTPSSSRDKSVECYTSTFQLADANHNMLEGKGVTPDIWVGSNLKEALKGKDPQIIAAINYINNNQR